MKLNCILLILLINLLLNSIIQATKISDRLLQLGNFSAQVLLLVRQFNNIYMEV